jgi:predicted esterase
MGRRNPFLLHVETMIHGRVLMSEASAQGHRGLLVGFHGYAENARIQLDRLLPMASQEWLVCSVQALHPFYTRTDGEVVASWMTRLDRELAIAQNLDYVSAVLQRVRSGFASTPEQVFCGFSQGAAMAYRAAVTQPARTISVAAIGGDVPPELNREALSRLKTVLVARGLKDRHYSAEKMDEDLRRLALAEVPICTFTFEGAHQWQDVLTPRIHQFLAR